MFLSMTSTRWALNLSPMDEEAAGHMGVICFEALNHWAYIFNLTAQGLSTGSRGRHVF